MAGKNETAAVNDVESASPGKKVSQSAFVRQYLTKKPRASYRELADKFAKENNGAELNGSLFYQIRAKLGISGRDSRGTSDAPNRSEYIRKNLLENPDLGPAELNNLWQQEGFPGELRPALYYQVKRRMKLSSERPARRSSRGPGRPRKASSTTTRTLFSERQTQYVNIEKALDELIQQAEQLNDNKLSGVLRQARRQVSVALV